jgi:aryl-alcohol dehydrogenase-like predicted oxidoreductase
MALPTRILGRTGVEVTQLGYGAMEVRGTRIWGGRPCSDSQAEEILTAVLDSGINMIDTANDYGKSELYIGRYLADRRDEYFLATKCGCHMQFGSVDHDETPHVWTQENVLRNIADSLLKMQTDHVDLLQLHNPDPETVESMKIVETMQDLKKAGVVRFLGCSTTVPHIQTYLDWDVFDVYQIPYSALERRHENWITKAGEAGAGIIVRGGVARGEPGEGVGSSDRWGTFEKAGLDELREPGESRTAFLLRYTLSHPYCHTTIVGTMKAAHLQENIRIAEKGPLPDDVYAEAKRRLSEAGEEPED